MFTFALLLSSILTFNTSNISSGSTAFTPQEIQITFSEEPVAFESGQPVYPATTHVTVKTPKEKTLLIVVDGGKEMKKHSKEVDITKYLSGRVGTHTVMVKTLDSGNESIDNIFGFNIK